jgi:hypothetical protein
LTSLALVAAGWLLASAAEAARPVDLYYERSLMAATGARCGLFAPPVEAALNASAVQARNAALRAGRPQAEIEAVRDAAAAQAKALACASPETTQAAQRVRGAFEGWSHVTRVVYPGADGGWTADRMLYRSASWRLVESGGAGAAFGVAGDLAQPAALAAVLAGETEAPYGARLKLRDPRRVASPWLPGRGVSQIPPAEALLTVFAEAKAPAGPGLAHGSGPATAFRFPASAMEALAALDPRERFEVEFLLPGGRTRTAQFEVGDFAAGRAFLAMGGR